jgi:four helix bundle protein
MERRIELGTRNKAQRTDNGPRRKGDDIAERLLDAVEGVRQLLPGLRLDAPSKHAAKHVAKQLWRATTGGGANYEEARGAESRADFIHKIRVATKELREAHYWLRVVQRSTWLEPGATDRLVDETDQLVAILVASATTAKSSTSS